MWLDSNTFKKTITTTSFLNLYFFFNDTATTEIYTLSLHDALPICARKGELAWMPLRHWRVLRTLHNPRYAGAFVYGQRREARNPATGKKTMITVPREQWFAFIPDTHPGYISFAQY